jgi:hypothetical protein
MFLKHDFLATKYQRMSIGYLLKFFATANQTGPPFEPMGCHAKIWQNVYCTKNSNISANFKQISIIFTHIVENMFHKKDQNTE